MSTSSLSKASINRRAALAVPIAAVVGFSGPAHAVSFSDLYKNSLDAINKRVYRAIGSLRICAANELKPWLINDVVPRFRENEKSVIIPEGNLIFGGSGDIADAWNNGNKDRCDIVVFGSDVAALRGTEFERTKAVSLGYSPTVFIGQKEKFAVARDFLKKGPADPLSCSDLTEVAKKGRMSRLKPGSTGKLTLEMSTSNSGQSGFVSCVYSELNAESAKEVTEALDGSGGRRQARRPARLYEYGRVRATELVEGERSVRHR
jgi:hypothetical protein